MVLMKAIIFNIQKFSIHDGPGIRTTVFFKGCPLSCLWCSNPESQNPEIQPELDSSLAGKMYTLDEVVKVCLADKVFYDESNGGVTLSGGEAFVQADFAVELLLRLKSEGIHTALETSGYTSPENFMKILQHVNLLLFDLKHYDNDKHLSGTGVDTRLIFQNLKNAIKSDVSTLIRIPVIPDYNDSLDDAHRFADFVKKLGLSEIQLLPFHQFGQRKYELLGMQYKYAKYKTLHPEDLEDYRITIENNGIRCFF